MSEADRQKTGNFGADHPHNRSDAAIEAFYKHCDGCECPFPDEEIFRMESGHDLCITCLGVHYAEMLKENYNSQATLKDGEITIVLSKKEG